MPRAVWKGAIAFGLVNVPVAMYPASQETEVDFDWFDRRTLDPVGYKRVNKRSGREIAKEDVVKGVKTDGGDVVVLDDEEIRAAYPKTTQTIEIESFVPAHEVSFVHIEKPYYLEPVGRSDKAYALLREALAEASLLGIARLVMHNKEHLAALLPAGPALMLGTLRWAGEIRSAEGLQLPAAGKGALKPQELQMAGELIRRMQTRWQPQRYEDRFGAAIRELVERKAEAGQAAKVEPLEKAPAGAGAEVVDLAALLRDSLGRRGSSKGPARRRSAR